LRASAGSAHRHSGKKNSRECVLAPATVESISITLEDAVNGELPVHADTLKTNISVPQAGQAQLRLLRRVGQVIREAWKGYRRTGGYEALRRASNGALSASFGK